MRRGKAIFVIGQRTDFNHRIDPASWRELQNV